MDVKHKCIVLNFSGGCELFFNKVPTLNLSNVVPQGTSLGELVTLIKERYVQERPEFFADPSGLGVRPGILVLVNGCDAEVVGGMTYVLEDGDEVDFISTLHGG